MANSSKDLKAGQKAFSVQIYAILVVFCAVTFLGLFLQKSSTNSLFNSSFQEYQHSAKFMKDIYKVHSNLYKIQTMVSINQDKQEITNLSDKQAAIISANIEELKKVLASDISDEQKKYYSAVMNNLVEYQKMTLRFIKLAPMGTGAAYLVSADEKMQAVTQLLSDLMAYESKAGEDTYSSSNIKFYIIIVLLLAFLAAAVILSTSLIGKAIAGMFLNPIKETSGVLREYAEGKYAKALTWEANDEMGELVHSVNAVKTKLTSTTASAPKAQTSPAAPPAAAPAADDSPKSLTGMIKKSPEGSKDNDGLVMSSKKAIDKLQDI